jgi:hypothetical protein
MVSLIWVRFRGIESNAEEQESKTLTVESTPLRLSRDSQEGEGLRLKASKVESKAP